jgi:shikimate kinase
MGHIFLVGFMGAGKSTVGTSVAGALGLPFLDLDSVIEVEAGMAVREVFEKFGEERFRALEHAALADLEATGDTVVACGGGVVLRDENRALLKRLGTVVYLVVDAGEALARIGDTHTRPLLSGSGGTVAATALLAARKALYAAVADITVDTHSKRPDDVVAEVLAALRGQGVAS